MEGEVDPWDTFVRPHHDRLVESMRLSMHLDLLYTKRLVDREEYNQLQQADADGTNRAVRILLMDILPKKLPKWQYFNGFIKVLEACEHQRALADLIRPPSPPRAADTTEAGEAMDVSCPAARTVKNAPFVYRIESDGAAEVRPSAERGGVAVPRLDARAAFSDRKVERDSGQPLTVPRLQSDKSDRSQVRKIDRQRFPGNIPSVNAPTAASRKRKKVLAVCDEWRSSKGGLTTLNRLLCTEGLAKIPGTEVACQVTPYKDKNQDKKAESYEDEVKKAEDVEDADTSGVALMINELDDSFTPDIVIGHQHVTGPKAKKLADKTQAIRVHFLHTWPEELERAKDPIEGPNKALEKEDVQVDLAKSATVVAAIGPLLSRKWRKHLVRDVVDVTPGLPCAREKPEKRFDSKELSCLIIGRLEDRRVKGTDIVENAIVTWRDLYAKECKLKFVFRGEPEENVGTTEKNLKERCDYEHIRVNRFDSSPKRIAEEICRSDLVLMPSRAEGFGLVALEALSLGIPCLVHKGSGFAEAVTEAAKRHLEYQPENGHWLDKWFLDTQKLNEKVAGILLASKIYARIVCKQSFETTYNEAGLLRGAYEKTFCWRGAANQLIQACRRPHNEPESD